MGTVIPATMLSQAKSLSSDVTAVQQTAQNGLNGELGDLMKFAELIGGILEKVQAIGFKIKPQQQLMQGMGNSPAMIPATQEQTVQATPPVNPQATQEVQKVKTLSKQKIEQLVRETFIIQAENLPEEIKEMKVGDIVGKNFASFKFNYKKVFPVTSDIIVSKIAEQLMKTIPNLYEEE